MIGSLSSRTAADDHELADKVALVTGAGRGMGAAIAKTLARAGAAVGLVALEQGELTAVAGEIEQSGGRCVVVPVDFRREGAGSAVVAQVNDSLGPIQILVNNAALQLFGPVLEFDEAAFRAMVDVNLTTPYCLARAVLPEMVRLRRGWIVSIASDLAYRVRVGGAAYCSTKRGLLALSEVLQLEHREDGICVSTILPGITATTWDGLPPDHPSKVGHLDPQQIADAVLWCVTRPAGARIDTLVIHPPVQNSV